MRDSYFEVVLLADIEDSNEILFLLDPRVQKVLKRVFGLVQRPFVLEQFVQIFALLVEILLRLVHSFLPHQKLFPQIQHF